MTDEQIEQIDRWWKVATEGDRLRLVKHDLPFLRKELIGLTVEDAESYVESLNADAKVGVGMYIRVRSGERGQRMSTTQDYKPWRVDVDVRNGMIVGAE